MKTSFTTRKFVTGGGLLLLGLILGWLLFGGSPTGQQSTDEINQHIEDTHTDEEGNIVYTCSMHPQVRQDEPGNCPICGMELIPAGDGGGDRSAADDPYSTTMTEVAMRIAQVETAEVTRQSAIVETRMPGKVMIDERNLSIIPAHFPGRVEKLYLDFTGAYVEQGDPIAAVYSPELVTAQKELMEAYQNRESNPRLYQATRQKFLNWEISPSVIDRILKQGEPQRNFDIYSTRSGYVTERHVAVGDHIMFGNPIFEVADLSDVWIEFEAYENDLAEVTEGDDVQFSVATYPGETFEAHITYIDPILDDRLRTATVRAEANNPDLKLKPNMLVRGIVSSEVSGGAPQLQVPVSAVLWTGERSLVYVQDPSSEQPSFRAREVTLGKRSGATYIIKDGLSEGERVVIKGNFMIDSAAQLADKRSMMNRQPGQGNSGMSGGHNHGSGSAPMESGGETMNMPSSEAQLQDSVSTAFREQLNGLAAPYLDASSALASDNLAEALSAVEAFGEALGEVDMQLITGEQRMAFWMDRHKKITSILEALEQSESIAEFREQFASLSDRLTETYRRFGVSQTLYLQYCPMARDSQGAYWLSSEKSISNPYMGQQMPGCGSTRDTLGTGSR